MKNRPDGAADRPEIEAEDSAETDCVVSRIRPARQPAAAFRRRPGATPIETGAKGMGFGLSSGGGGGDSSLKLDVKDFCCPEYITT